MSRRFGWGRRYTLDATDKDPTLQSFILRIMNVAGVMRHAFIGDRSLLTTPPAFAWKIAGISSSFTDTPLVDNVTAFAAGGGIDASATDMFVFDTADQPEGQLFGEAHTNFNSTATVGVLAQIQTLSLNVNGTSKRRLALKFGIDGTGGSFALAPGAAFPAGKEVSVRVGLVALY